MKRLFTICLMLAAMMQAAIAQQEKGLVFTSLDWNEMRIDSVLPVYTEVVPLETDYRTHTYTVSLLYPEYAPLSGKEARVAEQFDSLINETIDVETFVGVERGKGLLDISFIPIRRQGSSAHKSSSMPSKTEGSTPPGKESPAKDAMPPTRSWQAANG